MRLVKRVKSVVKSTALTCGMLFATVVAAQAAPSGKGVITASITDVTSILQGQTCGGTYSSLCVSGDCTCFIYTGTINGAAFGGGNKKAPGGQVEVDLTEDTGAATTTLGTGATPLGCAPVFADVFITGAKNGNNQTWALLGTVCDALGTAKTSTLTGGFTTTTGTNVPQFGTISAGSTAGIDSAGTPIGGTGGGTPTAVNMTINFTGM
jgi:hypothetical protein